MQAEELVKFERPAIQAQLTPDIQAKGVKDKRWKPREWLEVEFPFKAGKLKDKPDAKFHDSLTFKYYVVLDGKQKKMLTAEVVHVNIPMLRDAATVVYISPSTIENLTGEERVNPAIVKSYGIEVFRGTDLVGLFSSVGGTNKFWEAPAVIANYPASPGLLLTKAETPFAPLWGDYHVETQKK
jgi:hypothetical protein